MTHLQRNIAIALAATLALTYVKETYLGDPRWWNLVMAGMLVVVLILYLRRERREREER